MDEHPGDTLGQRFLAFWGAVGAILLLGLVLLGIQWFNSPKSGAQNDGGASLARTAKLADVTAAQNAELGKLEIVDAAKGIIRVPVADAMPYALAVMKEQKEAAYTVRPIPGSPADLEKQKAVHDPALSEFEK